MSFEKAVDLMKAIDALELAQNGDSDDIELDAVSDVTTAAVRYLYATAARDVELADEIDAWVARRKNQEEED